jgi:hypothetical protein
LKDKLYWKKQNASLPPVIIMKGNSTKWQTAL